MHGRVKTSVQPSAQELAAKRAQIGKYLAAKDLFLQRRSARSMDARTAELTGKLIELNPDFYTLWALRKETLLNNIKAQSAQPAQLSTTGHKCSAVLRDASTASAYWQIVSLRRLCCVMLCPAPVAPCVCQARSRGRVVFCRAGSG